MRQADIAISVDGVAMIAAKTAAGWFWIGERCVFDRSAYSPITGIPCEPSYAEEIASGALLDGLQVDVNGHPTKMGAGGIVLVDKTPDKT